MTTLLKVENKLSAADSKTHIRYPFTVPEGSGALHIDFSYSPKEETDLDNAKKIIVDALKKFTFDDDDYINDIWKRYFPVTNLLTLSLDDPKEFRGAGHRPSPNQHIILSESEATVGFIPGEIIKGEWVLTLSAHAIVTSECNYKIHVWEGDD